MKIKEFIKKHSLFLCFTFFILCFSLFLTHFFMLESDYFWHIKAGEFMFNHGVLRKDVFSWYVKGKYWMSHEWLFEIIIYTLYLLFGKFHFFVYLFICVFILLFLLFFSNRSLINNNISFSLIWFTFSLFIIPSLQARPQLISFILLAFSVYAYYSYFYDDKSKIIYYMPLISIIWSNVHGGSSNLSYLLVFIFLVGGIFSFKNNKVFFDKLSKKQIKTYLIIALLCLLAVNINIHGFKMLLYPYENLMNKTMLSTIREWAPTNLNETVHLSYFSFLVIIFLILLFSKRKISFIDLLLFGFCVFLGLKSIRFWFFTYIIMSFVIFKYIPKIKIAKNTNSMIIGISILLVILFFSSSNAHLFVKRPKLDFSSNYIDIIKKEDPKRLFNSYNYGGELVYNEIPVFIDGRADLYSNYNYLDNLSLRLFKKNFYKLLDKYDFDYFIVSIDDPICTYLNSSDSYELIYKENDIYFFKRKES